MTALATAQATDESGYSRMVVFGDSLSDTGNVLAATSGGPPEFISPGPLSWFEGRFTGGLVWHEVLADGLGIERATSNLIFGGSNYAFGGAEAGPGSSVALGVPNVGLQIQLYLGTAPPPTGDELFVLQAGNNDFLRPTGPADPEDLVEFMVADIRLLASLGARHFLVAGSDLRARTPGFNPPLDEKLFGFAPPPELVADILQRSQRYNRLLRRALWKTSESLRQEGMDVAISYVDVYLAGELVGQLPRLFDLVDVTTPAVQYAPVPLPPCFCEAEVAGSVANPSQFFFHDIVHPGPTLHGIYGYLARKQLRYKAKRKKFRRIRYD